MKRALSACLSLAALSLVYVIPQLALAKTPGQSMATQDTAQQIAGKHEARMMVPTQAALIRAIDARKAMLGDTVRAKLSMKARLKNGTELPSGTILIGTVTADDLNMAGKAKLTLRFTDAKLKNGKVIPIKATIVGLFPPSGADGFDNTGAPGDQIANTWNDQTLQVDELEAVSGVDLHSRVASKNSGTLVSTRKKDIKLPAGSELALAIGAQNSAS